MKKAIFILFALAIISLLAFSCASRAPVPPGAIIDDLGREVLIKEFPDRIISLAPSNTEILFALGLGDKVVGVTQFCNYPEEAKLKEKIGGFTPDSWDLEKIVALEPDLLVATGGVQGPSITKLEERGLNVFALYPKTLDGLLYDITLIGRVTGKEKKAEELTKDLRKRISAVANKTEGLSPEERQKVLLVVWHEPIWTVGPGTMEDELIRIAGGKNIAYDLEKDYWPTELEKVVARNPEVIIAYTGHGEATDLPLEWARTEDRLKDIDARIHDRIYQISTGLMGHRSLRMIDALELLAKFIHPEIFGEA